ncbi:MAG: TolC family outer membrane protein [Rhodocyclaceae bacterium]
MYKKLSAAICLALTAQYGYGATLGEVAERALANSPEVRARLHEFLSSSEDQDAAKGARLPRVDLESYYGRERLDTNVGNVQRFNHPGVNLQLRQLLWDGFATRNEIRRLGHNKAARYYDLLATSDEISLEAVRSYFDVQRYRQLSQLAQDNWAVHKETYDQIEQRVKAGVGRRVDLEQAAGRLALAQSNWLTESSNLHDVTARFQRIVGELPPVLAESPSVAPKLPAEKDVLPTAVKQNPTFLSAVSGVRSARSQTAVRRAANSPTFEARGSHSLERNHGGTPGHYSDTVAQVVMNYNLFRGGSDQARIRSAEEQFNTAIAIRDKTCRDLRQIAVIATNDLRKLREQIQYLEQHALSTEKARDAYRQQFDIGQRSLLDVLDTENELFEARRALERARYDLKLAEFRVLAATHTIMPTLGLAPGSNISPLEEQGDESELDGAANCDTSMTPPQTLDTAAAMAGRPPRTFTLQPDLLAATPPRKPAADAPVPEHCQFAAQDWAAAWSAKDLDKYLGYYSPGFEPMTRADQKAWKQLRAERLNKPYIAVKLADIKVKQISASSCEVSFNQQYRSSDYNDDVNKTLVIRREADSSWKIQREVAPRKASTN